MPNFKVYGPMRTANERDEVARVFNLPPNIVKTVCFNSAQYSTCSMQARVYLRIHQSGFGCCRACQRNTVIDLSLVIPVSLLCRLVTRTID